MIYVHGYGMTVDTAWDRHRLPTQFAASRQNAVFAAVSAPSSSRGDVEWLDLATVRDELDALTGLRPAGPVVVVAYSGGYRTVAQWIQRAGGMDQITLLDALYANVEEFAGWVASSATSRRTMNLVSCRTGTPRANAALLLRRLREPKAGLVSRMGVPPGYQDFTVRQRHARVLCIVADQTHTSLVTEGAVLPVLLRRSPLRLLPNVPLQAGENP